MLTTPYKKEVSHKKREYKTYANFDEKWKWIQIQLRHRGEPFIYINWLKFSFVDQKLWKNNFDKKKNWNRSIPE